jgi:hypothetical protein
MNRIEAVLAELHKFSSDLAELGPACDPQLVESFERGASLVLPADYKEVVARIDGFSLMGAEVYGLKGGEGSLSLETVYQREHVGVRYPQPAHLVPFSPDGGGNFYCFDTRYLSKKTSSCPVVFWVSNYLYTEEDTPEVVYHSFLDFVEEVIIGWTLEGYDYEGNER